MNQTGFPTYRACHTLQKVYQDMYNITSSPDSLQHVLESCSDYFLTGGFIPDSLIGSLSKIFFEKIEVLIKSGQLSKKTAEDIFSHHIYTYSYKNTSSSMTYFLERLHVFCDSLA